MATAATQGTGLENQLLSALFGKNTQTTTTSNNITDEGINRIIQQILSNPANGVAAIGNAARGSGLYNSTVENQQVNDLATRAAGEAARQGATQTKVTKMSGGVSPGMALALPLITSIGKPLIQPLLDKGSAVLGKAGQGIADFITGGTGDAAATAGSLAAPISSSIGSGAAAIGGTAGTLGSGTFGLDTGSGGLLDSLLGGTGSTLAGDTATAATTAGDAATATTAGLGSFGLPVGSFLSGLTGGFDAADPTSMAKTFALATAFGGPLGGVGAVGAQVIGSIINDFTVICTALKDRGLIDTELHAKGWKHNSQMSLETKVGYHLWAVPIAQKIREGSKFWTNLCLPVAASRTKLLARVPGIHWLGLATVYLGEPVCTMIGHLVKHKILGRA